jgi:hypothetical protein
VCIVGSFEVSRPGNFHQLNEKFPIPTKQEAVKVFVEKSQKVSDFLVQVRRSLFEKLSQQPAEPTATLVGLGGSSFARDPSNFYD